MEQHIKKLEKEDKVLVYKIEFKGVQKIDNPMQGVQVGYSNIVEVFLLTSDLDRLIHLAMHYGPTNIEIFEPHNIKVSSGEAQGIVNSIADLVHLFARSNMGGLPIKRKEAELQE